MFSFKKDLSTILSAFTKIATDLESLIADNAVRDKQLEDAIVELSVEQCRMAAVTSRALQVLTNLKPLIGA